MLFSPLQLVSVYVVVFSGAAILLATESEQRDFMFLTHLTVMM